VFSAGVLLWSALTGMHLFEAGSTGAAMNNTLKMAVPPPSQVGLKPPPVFDAICMRALERNVNARLDSALEFEESLRAAATANGLCGSRREVAEWVQEAVGEELTERRNANKVSGNQRVARRFSPAGGIGAVSDSRLKAADAANDAPVSVEPISVVSKSHLVERESAPVIESAPISARELGTEGRQRKLWLLAGSAVVLLGGVAFGVTHLNGGASNVAPALSVAAQRQAGVPATAALATAPQEQAKASATAETGPAQPAATSRSIESSHAESSHRQAGQRSVRRGAPSAVQPAGAATPTPKTESAAAASEPRAKKPTWDEDSPLPHP
jgi:hypothetical protein